jgi:hypothetical protein
MKKISTQLVFIFLIGSTYAQSKKEQIEYLVSQKDSLAALLIKERDLSNTTFDSLNNVVEAHVLQLRKYGNIIDSLNVQILAERSTSKQVVDSLVNQNKLIIKEMQSLKNSVSIVPDDIKISKGDYQDEVMSIQQVSFPSNPILEKKINDSIAFFFNLSRKHKCDPIHGFNKLIKNAPENYKYFSEWNNFESYNLYKKNDEHIILILGDENGNIIWYDINIDNENVSFLFNRIYLDDPEREH